MKLIASSNLSKVIRSFKAVSQKTTNWKPFFKRAGDILHQGIKANFDTESADGVKWQPFSPMSYIISEAIAAQKAGTRRNKAIFRHEVRNYTRTVKTKTGTKTTTKSLAVTAAYNPSYTKSSIVGMHSRQKLLNDTGKLYRAATRKRAKGSIYELSSMHVKVGVKLKSKKGKNYPLFQQKGATIKVSAKMRKWMASHGVYLKLGSTLKIPARPFMLIRHRDMVRIQRGAMNYIQTHKLP